MLPGPITRWIRVCHICCLFKLDISLSRDSEEVLRAAERRDTYSPRIASWIAWSIIQYLDSLHISRPGGPCNIVISNGAWSEMPLKMMAEMADTCGNTAREANARFIRENFYLLARLIIFLVEVLWHLTCHGAWMEAGGKAFIPFMQWLYMGREVWCTKCCRD